MLSRKFAADGFVRILSVLLLVGLDGGFSLAAQDFHAPTELPGKPFVIKKSWVIGGEGNWDYLTLDPAAQQLFVAHGHVVQVVDVGAGTVFGRVAGMQDAHGIALDDSGNLGYVSDGPGNEVDIFDRRTLQVLAKVRTGPNPRAIVFDPATKLVFAICTENLAAQPTPNPSIAAARQAARGSSATQRGVTQREFDPELRSVVTVIDSETSRRVADILLPGRLGYAQADGEGQIYIGVTDRNAILRFDARAVANALEPQLHAASSRPDASPGTPAQKAPPVFTLDWSKKAQLFPLGSGCTDPRSLAVDPANQRIFAACANMRMQIIDADQGNTIATLPTGPGTDAIGYDPNHGLIFTSNGGGDGSITVIRQHVTDSYAVVQQLPTQQRARTLAVNPQTGEVYVVTNMIGFDLSKPGVGGDAHTLPVVNATPVRGSFQVLVIGN